MWRALKANATVIWTWLATVIIVHALHYGLGRGQPSLGLALSSAALPALIVALTPVRGRRVVMIGTVFLVALAAAANAAYFRFFQRYIPLESIAGAADGAKHASYLPGLLRLRDAIPLVVAAITAAAVAVIPRRRAAQIGAGAAGAAAAGASAVTPRRLLVAFPIACCVLGLVPAVRWAWVVSPGDHDSGTGGFIYSEMADARRILGNWMIPADPSPDEWQRVLTATARHDSSNAPDAYAAAAAGSNVLIVKVEGMNAWLLDLDVDGQPVMPFLRSLAARGLRFTNLYDAAREGRSSDADYLILASQEPLERGAVSLIKPHLVMTALPQLLAARGYATFSADAGSPLSWNAAVRHRAFGFTESKFGPDFPGAGHLGYGLPDSEFFARVTPLVEGLRPPFLAWLHTVTMHGPHHDFPDSLRTLQLGALNTTSFGTYLQKAHYTDRALQAFFAHLDSAGTLARTTVVVYGDHTETFEFDPAAVARATGIAALPDGAHNPALEKIPLIIVPAFAATTVARGHPAPFAPGAVATVGTLIDASPTLLHLLDIPQPRSMLGHSLVPPAARFAASASGTVAGPDRYWTGRDCYALREGAKRPATECVDLATRARAQLETSWLITRYGLSTRLDALHVP